MQTLALQPRLLPSEAGCSFLDFTISTPAPPQIRESILQAQDMPTALLR